MAQRKKVLFAIDALYGGGAEKVLVSLLKTLDRSRFELELFLFTHSGIYLRDVPADVKIHFLFDSVEDTKSPVRRFARRLTRSLFIRLVKLLPALWKIFVPLSQKYDMGVSFCEGLNVCLLEEQREKFTRRIAWVHTHLDKHKFVLSKERYAKAVAGFDQIAFVAQNCMDVFKKLFPTFPEEKLVRLYNPLDVAGIVEKGREVCPFFGDNSSAGAKQNVRTILSIGRLAHVKRFDRLIEAFALVAGNTAGSTAGAPLRLVILGDGPERAALAALAEKLGVAGNVTFAPFCVNPFAWLARADVFVSSSDYEGLPLVVEEAMVLAVPIVATCTLGAAEITENGKYALLTDFSAGALASALQRVLTDADLAGTMRKKLLAARSQNLFLFPSNTDQIENFLLS